MDGEGACVEVFRLDGEQGPWAASLVALEDVHGIGRQARIREARKEEVGARKEEVGARKERHEKSSHKHGT
jgi:hypothetical protein